MGPEPPTLALPSARKAAAFFGGHSLPTLPSNNWAINYGHPSDVQEEKPRDTQLVYHRKANKPSIPAPLYYRERAAIIHSSPALAPSSPSARRVTPPTFWSPQLTSTKAIPELDLAPSVAPVPTPPIPSTTNCGRPGCVGIPSRPRIADVAHPKDSQNRRKSWTSAPPGALKTTSSGDSSDVLMSPRIRALRASEGGLGLVEPLDDSEMGGELEGEDDGQHSAFACYLFSQLADKSAPADEDIEEMIRGRTATPAPPADQRSMSVDAAALASRNATSTPSHGRPTRFLFSRGTPTTPAGVENEPLLDQNATIRAPTTSSRAPLTAGHFISATTASGVSGASPFPSPPPSPPTAGRGRSTARTSDVADDPRGRSKLRGPAIERSLSRPRESRSRGRQSSRGPGGEREERDSRSSGRRESTGRESRPRESRGRGRGGRRDEDVVVEEVVEEEEQDRGRGRARSRSLLRRGMGREVAISGAAYGHDDQW